jgi:hypothetical protein
VGKEKKRNEVPWYLTTFFCLSFLSFDSTVWK